PRYECLPRMSRHAKKLRDHDINPCVAETDATTKCMNDNNYNKDMCTDYFLKYKNCRKFWHEIMMQRKRSGFYLDDSYLKILFGRTVLKVLNHYLILTVPLPLSNVFTYFTSINCYALRTLPDIKCLCVIPSISANKSPLPWAMYPAAKRQKEKGLTIALLPSWASEHLCMKLQPPLCPWAGRDNVGLAAAGGQPARKAAIKLDVANRQLLLESRKSRSLTQMGTDQPNFVQVWKYWSFLIVLLWTFKPSDLPCKLGLPPAKVTSQDCDSSHPLWLTRQTSNTKRLQLHPSTPPWVLHVLALDRNDSAAGESPAEVLKVLAWLQFLKQQQSYAFLSHRPQAICEVLTELQAVSLVALKSRENIIKLDMTKTREKRTTVAPRLANFIAKSLPMPLPAPVINTISPLTFFFRTGTTKNTSDSSKEVSDRCQVQINLTSKALLVRVPPLTTDRLLQT
ncbi:Coiled-coil-helix-coiled-coil-helix domain-containing protein 7, partial [Lamprotornis superbus]